jgi:metal-dependent amidase/aminoacylase/carboxypeptidase family protein
MEGTVRCLHPDDRALMEGRIRRVVEDTASAFGATAELNWIPGYPVTVNHEDATGWAVEAARAVANGWMTPPTPSCRPKTSPTC